MKTVKSVPQIVLNKSKLNNPSKSINETNNSSSKIKKTFNDRIYHRYNKQKDNNYLSNYYINKKNVKIILKFRNFWKKF